MEHSTAHHDNRISTDQQEMDSDAVS